ncbi:MAG: AAA family ATPase [Planctomycetota bacterium]|nr:AAA family ATPase [Planctomycetota bacterium]
MASQIALFNHKGGVSKTTTCFNLGWMLANKGKQILLVDCDPQCNLTGMVLGFRGEEEFNTVYEAPGIKNIRDGLAPAFESRPNPIVPVDCEEVAGQPNMHLLPGHIGLAEYEVTLGIAHELSGSLVTLQNLPGSLSHLFSLTADIYDADYIIIDMSPSLGAINQNLLMTSDFFIVPMAPDYFSVMATDSLATVLPKWAAWSRQASQNKVLRNATYPYPDKMPKFLGTVVQKYRPRKGGPSQAFQKWIDDIEAGVRKNLIPRLEACSMLLDKSVYDAANCPLGSPLLQMSDFNSLIALSQKHSAPIFELTDQQLGQTGTVLENTKRSMHKFRELYSDAADRINQLIDHA